MLRFLRHIVKFFGFIECFLVVYTNAKSVVVELLQYMVSISSSVTTSLVAICMPLDFAESVFSVEG